MNKYKFLLPLILLACTNPEKNPADDAGPSTSHVNCYRYINNRDTVDLRVVAAGENITGDLVYNFFEKDRNEGTIQGYIKDGVLIAIYSFRAEGMQSIRQVAFKKTGDGYTEGSGELDLTGKEVRFVNTDSLDFSGGIFLKPFDCNERPGDK